MTRFPLLALLVSSQAALADVPRVVTDIAPIQGLAAAVMDGLGTPDILLPPGADPHGYAMRPSDAAALEAADIVIWVGEGLTPWLEGPIDTLAGGAAMLELLEVDGTRLIETGDDDDDGHGDDGHGHGAIDPHAWLDPDNALFWLAAIAEALATADPDNSVQYRANAGEASALIAAQIRQTETALSGLDGTAYAVHHDAFRYFEDRFGLAHAFAVVSYEGDEPGPRRIAELQAVARHADVTRLIAEPGPDLSRLAGTIFTSGSAKICEIDPLGAGIEPGKHHYRLFLKDLTDRMRICLEP